MKPPCRYKHGVTSADDRRGLNVARRREALESLKGALADGEEGLDDDFGVDWYSDNWYEYLESKSGAEGVDCPEP